MKGIAGKVLILLVIPLILYVGLLPLMPLMEPDEGRYSSIPSAMNKSGDYITPRLKGAVYFEKPPLAYWATALAFKLFGENEFSSRLFSGLCAWGCILLVFSMGKALQDEKTGLYAAAVLTTSLFHFAIGRINILDMPVAFFLSLAIWSGYRYFDAWRKRWLYLFYLATALAFLTKGLIGIVFPVAIIVIWLLSVRRWREVFKLLSPLGILIFLALSLPWLYLVQKANGDFLRFFFIQEHFQRYTTTIHHRNEPVYYFIPIIILGTMPWCAFLVKAMRERAPEWKKVALFPREAFIFLLVWSGFIFLFFSLSSSKLIPYIAALFLPLAIIQGEIFSRYDGQRGGKIAERAFGWDSLPVILQSLLFIIAFVAAPFFERDRPDTLWWPWIILPIIMQVLLIFLPGYVKRRMDGNWFLTIYLVSAIFLAATLFPLANFLGPHKSAYVLTQAIKKYVPADRELYQFDMSLYGIDFYGKMRTPIVDDIGEVRYGSDFLPPRERSRYFLDSPGFFKLLKERKEIYCATKGEKNVGRLKKEAPHLTVLWDNKYYYLLKLENVKRS